MEVNLRNGKWVSGSLIKGKSSVVSRIWSIGGEVDKEIDVYGGIFFYCLV